jgi:isoleucyl-tRNA synthetase
MSAAIENFGDYIKTQVLANTIDVADNDGVETEFDDFTLKVKVIKA